MEVCNLASSSFSPGPKDQTCAQELPKQEDSTYLEM